MKRHPRTVATAVALAVVMSLSAVSLAACAPSDEPEPTPTAAFASDEEAFAAAEETYRAYVDALNEAREGGDVDPLSFLVGDALTGGIETAQILKDQKQTITGQTQIISLNGVSVDNAHVTIQTCIDVSETRVLSADGEDQTPPDRPPRVTLEVALEQNDGLLRIRSSEATKLSC